MVESGPYVAGCHFAIKKSADTQFKMPAFILRNGSVTVDDRQILGPSCQSVRASQQRWSAFSRSWTVPHGVQNEDITKL